MGGITSAISSIASAADAVTGGANALSLVSQITDAQSKRSDLRAQQNVALRQLQSKQQNELTTLQQNVSLEKQKLSQDYQSSEAERLAALKRATARQRAALGASGISVADGSGEAILLGLFDESDTERTERERLDNLRLKSIDQDVALKQQENLLELSQLREKQALQRSILR